MPRNWPVGFLRYCISSSAGVQNSSSIPMPRGLRARGFNAARTRSGTITVRDQYETLSMWKGAHLGRSNASTRITGTARHGTCPNKARVKRVNTLQRAAPPCLRMALRAHVMWGASMSSPVSLRA